MINRTKQALWGTASDFFWSFSITLAALVTTPIILQFLPRELYGFWIATLSTLNYLGLMDLSLGMAFGHFVAKLPEKEGKSFNQLISSAFFSFLAIGLIVLVIGWGMSSYIPFWFKIPHNDSAAVVLAFRIAVAGLALSLPLSTFNAAITGGQHMAVPTTIIGITLLTGTGLSIILLYSGFGLISLAIAQFFTVSTIGLAGYLFCKFRYYKKIKISATLIAKLDLRQLWAYGGYLQLGRIANTVALSTDAILIAAVLGAVEVPTYTFTSKLTVLVSAALVSKLPSALFPALSQMFANREMGKIRGTFIRLAVYSLRTAMVFGVFIIIANKEFVSLWVGPELFAGNALNLVFVSWIFIDSLYRGTGVVLQASGNLKGWSVISITEAVLNIGISLFLVSRLGLIGIALGTTISRAVSGVLFMKLACHKTQLSGWLFILKGIFSPVLRSIPSCCVVIVCAYIIPQTLEWVWLCLLLSAGLGVNILSFEGIELMKPSSLPFKDRLRNIFVLRPV